MKRIGFIGVGNMGSAMLKPIAHQQETTVVIYDINKEICHTLATDNVKVAITPQSVVEQSDIIFLTIKPQYYAEVCELIKNTLTKDHIIVTVAPGMTIKKMHTLLGEHIRVIRTMPNTPAMIGCGVTAYCHGSDITVDESMYIEKCFNSFGRSYRVAETQMDAVVPVAGSSPAYGYLFIEAMADAAVRFGLPRQMAYEMAALSIKGACEMVLETKQHPGVLKDAVTSPGGTTIEAVAMLEATGFRNSIISSMTACYDKTTAMQ